MDRRNFCKTGLLTTASVGFKGSVVGKEAVKRKCPNLLYIFPDEMRGSAMGFVGEEAVITPNLDSLAKESLVLTHSASNYPVCVPYRTMFMSGKYPFKNGVRVNCFCDGREMKDDIVWWSDIVGKHGYEMGYLGKWHITKPISNYRGKKIRGAAKKWLPENKAHGFKHWFVETNNHHMHNTYVRYDKPWQSERCNKWSVEYETDLAIDFLKNSNGSIRDPEKPFVLVISFNPPHSPYEQVPNRYRDMYDKDVEKLCTGYADIPAKDKRWGKYYRKHVRSYYGCITGVDDNVGRILRCLKELDLEDDTIVIFTSDHGNCLGRHNKITKNIHYEESMRTPFMIRWPGRIKPRKDDLLLSTPDLYPTILELLGLKDYTPNDLDGVSYAKSFLGGKQKRPTSQIYMYIKEPNGDVRFGRRGVRTHRYTLMLERMPRNRLSGELFDNLADPYQMKNLIKTESKLAQKLIDEELIPWMVKYKDPFVLPKLDEL